MAQSVLKRSPVKNNLLAGLGPLAVWSLFVWVTRTRNIWTDDELSFGGQLWRFGVALTFTLGGLALVALMWRRRKTGLVGSDAIGVAAFAMFTVIYWVVRDAQILTADHSVGFKVVHLVLGVVSLVVAGIALRFVAKRTSPAAAAT